VDAVLGDGPIEEQGEEGGEPDGAAEDGYYLRRGGGGRSRGGVGVGWHEYGGWRRTQYERRAILAVDCLVDDVGCCWWWFGCRGGEVLGFGVQVSRWDGEISMGGGDLTGGR
jgi:hypothetical protein